MGTKKHSATAIAQVEGVIVGMTPHPKYTYLETCNVNFKTGVCHFQFKVKWYALPMYLGKAVWNTIRNGMRVQAQAPVINAALVTHNAAPQSEKDLPILATEVH